MQKMIHDAKTQYKYDPIRHAVGFYSDSVNMFIRFLLIFMNNKNKK